MFYFSWLILAHSNRTQLLTLGLVSQSRYMWNDAVWCGSLFQITLTVKLLFSFSIMLNLIKHLMVVITKVLGIYELKNLASQFALQFYISVHQQFFFFCHLNDYSYMYRQSKSNLKDCIFTPFFGFIDSSCMCDVSSLVICWGHC